MNKATSADHSEEPKRSRRRPLRFTGRTLLIIAAVVLCVATIAMRQQISCYYAAHRLSGLLDDIRIDQAVALAQKYSASQNCPKVQLLSVRAYRQAGDLQASATLLSDSEGLIGDPDRVASEFSLINARKGRVAHEESKLARLLNDPEMDQRDVCEAFVIGFRLNRRFDEAAALINAWKSDWPADYRPDFHEGLMHQTLTEWAAAVSSYERAVSLHPQPQQTRLRLGECLNQLERSSEACEQFQIVASHDPENTEAWQGLATGLRQQGKNAESRSAYLRVLELDPGSFSARLAIAEIDVDEGALMDADQVITALLTVWPDDTRALYLMSRIAVLQGQDSRAQEILKRWKLADAAVQKMEDQIQELAKTPDNADLQVSIGLSMLRYYSRDLGRQYLLAALQISPNHQAAIQGMSEFESKRRQISRMPVRKEPDRDQPNASDQ